MINWGAFFWWFIVFYLAKVAGQTDSIVLLGFACSMSFYLTVFKYPVFKNKNRDKKEENVDDEEL